MIKKYILTALVALSIPALVASAATPLLSVSSAGNGQASVQITGGEINSPVVLYYFSPQVGIYQGYSLGSTNASGTFSGNVNSNILGNFGANFNMPVYVQVGGYESARVMWPSGALSGTGSIFFSNSSPTVSVGGTGTVTLSGGSGTYYIMNNSNMGGVSASISGNTLTLQGAAAGTANITVCSTGGGCGTFTTTVSGTGSPTVSSSNLNVNMGGQGSVTLSGGTSPYTVSVLSGTGVSTTLMGNTLYINGHATGTNTLNVCSANGSCTPVTVNVQAQSNTGGNTGGSTGSTGGQSNLSLSLPISVGQNLKLAINGSGSGSFYIQSPMTWPALASINGNTLTINGQAVGSGTLTVCQTGGSCLPIQLAVSQPALTGTGGGHLFMSNLGMGAMGQDVIELQTRLKELGYFHANITGYFGGATKAAVQRYQRDMGISATGFVGVQTRAMLNR